MLKGSMYSHLGPSILCAFYVCPLLLLWYLWLAEGGEAVTLLRRKQNAMSYIGYNIADKVDMAETIFAYGNATAQWALKELLGSVC